VDVLGFSNVKVGILDEEECRIVGTGTWFPESVSDQTGRELLLCQDQGLTESRQDKEEEKKKK
jgi:hypothetical protein